MTHHRQSCAQHTHQKLLTFGAHRLSDTELLTALIGQPSPELTAKHALALLEHFGNIRTLIHATLPTFASLPNASIAHYAQLQAAVELSHRCNFISLQKNNQLKNTQETYTFLKRQLRDKRHETFSGLFLDSQYNVLHYEELSTGSVASTQVHPRPIVERVLALNATGLIVAHNHPSGLTDASSYDQNVTKRLKRSLALFDTVLVDHIIVGDNEVYSILRDVKWPCH